MTQALIPATSVLECFLKDGRFIMNVQGPDKKFGQLGMFEELQIKAHVKEHMKEVAKFESTTSDSQDNDIITSLNELLENFNQTTKL